MSRLKEALDHVRSSRPRRRQAVIDAMAPMKKVLLEYKRNLIVSDHGIVADPENIGHYLNRVVFDVGTGHLVITVKSSAPDGVFFVLHKNKEVMARCLEDAILTVAEIMVGDVK